MQAYYNLLLGTPLFAGVEAPDMPALLQSLGATLRHCEKDSFLFVEGDTINCFGVVAAGEIQILREDYLGHRSILATLAPGHLFAETFACAQLHTIPVSVLASREAEVILLDYSLFLKAGSTQNPHHTKLIANMLAVLAGKALALNNTLNHLAKRTIREKLVSYLSQQAKQAGGNSFSIPFSRQQLADYLCVDRSALSAELGRMRREGLLNCHRSSFALLPPLTAR
ncbi:MAG: Crp/Fnr family transcriptional regulator [Oscillospiraceae bacterium]